MTEEPAWLDRSEIDAIHDEQIERHGGAEGVRDGDLLESALQAPLNLWHYEQADIFMLAATYADRLANNHPYIDGNKRTALLAALVFLRLNGQVVRASNREAADRTLALASGRIDAAEFGEWLRSAAKPA